MSKDGFEERGWVEVQLHEDDLAALSKYYHEHTPAGRRRTRVLYGIAVIACVAWAYSVREHPVYGIAHPEKYALYVGIGVGVILAAFYFLLWYARPTLARLSASIGHRKGITKPTQFRVTPAGLELQQDGRTGTAPWGDIRAIGRTEKHLFLLTLGINGFILPARCFENAEAFARFADEAQRLKQMAKP
ncbi:MAG: hypothetical protein GC168_04620 [Candidatus Hydrogenedens sp.]|nr:hypothetical protein [Candidatus Hydrogenedens sp.]